MIGIDASRAFLSHRTGIEEYAYRVIRHLREPLGGERVILYVRKTVAFADGRFRLKEPTADFDLPEGWEIRGLFAPRFFTHVRLSLQMLLHPVDVLFVPAHTVPLIHPKRTVVVVHGLEYELFPAGYSGWERIYMRAVIRFSCKAAETVVTVSENTKRDVMRLYGTPETRIRVVYEGKPENGSDIGYRTSDVEEIRKPYLLFIGRIEERKNIVRMVEAFEILKAGHGIPHRLVLVGKPGYGYGRIRERILRSPYVADIVETGYVSAKYRDSLLRQADAFLFPTLYEGFGLPVVEAQMVGVPVVTSDISSLPEVGGTGAVYVDPLSPASVADGILRILSDTAFRDDIMAKGRENAERFDWDRCSAELAGILKG